MHDQSQPYYALPLLPPAQNLETIELYKALVPASAALAKLSAISEHLPNQAALYESVILLEARASSEIESVVTTDSRLFAPVSSNSKIDPMTKEVRRYADAIRYGWMENRPLCTSVMEQMCTIVKDKPMGVRKVPGTALTDNAGSIIYTPPDGETRLRDFLDNLFGWMNHDDGVNPIVKAALAHYQFESIHPFTDGNGRTGRMMVVLYLVEQKVLSAPVLFLSGEILRDKSSYYSYLQSTRESGDFLPYLIWFVGLVNNAAKQSIIRANSIRIEMLQLKREIRALGNNLYSQDLVNSLFRSPLVFANQLVNDGVVGSTTTAHTYLKKLEDAGLLLRSPRKYNRKVGYINTRLLNALKGEIDLNE